MQRLLSVIKAGQTEVRISRPRVLGQAGNRSFKDNLLAARKEESFNAAVSPFLRSKAYHAAKNPMKFGIMESTLKDYDPKGKIARHVSDLDENKARQIYQMIWDRAGCSKLSPGLAAQHFTAYVRRPRTANEALQKSGGDVEKYAAAITSAGSRTPYAAGHAQKQLLSNVADVSGPTNDMLKSRGIASRPIAERPAGGIETAVNNILPAVPQIPEVGIRHETVEAPHRADNGSSADNAVKESDNSQNLAQLKPLSASDVIHGAQSGSTINAELPIADNGMKIVIEKRDAHAGIEAYESAKSGKVFADGMFVKLRIPF